MSLSLTAEHVRYLLDHLDWPHIHLHRVTESPEDVLTLWAVECANQPCECGGKGITVHMQIESISNETQFQRDRSKLGRLPCWGIKHVDLGLYAAGWAHRGPDRMWVVNDDGSLLSDIVMVKYSLYVVDGWGEEYQRWIQDLIESYP
jgi:hypothetical protein